MKNTKKRLFEMMEKVSPDFAIKETLEDTYKISWDDQGTAEMTVKPVDLTKGLYQVINYQDNFSDNSIKNWYGVGDTTIITTTGGVPADLSKYVGREDASLMYRSKGGRPEIYARVTTETPNPIQEVGVAPDVVNAQKATTSTAQRANARIDTPQEFQDGFAAWLQTTGFDPQKKPLGIGQAQTMVRNAMITLGYK
jgi:hypothetical protein